jgi:Beta-lactamase enzyme family
VQRPRRARTSAVLFAVAVSAAPNPFAAARAALSLPRTAEGMQTRYDVGRRLEESIYAKRNGCPAHLALARGLVHWAEGYDRTSAALERAGRIEAVRASAARCTQRPLTRRLAPLPALPNLARAAPARSGDVRLRSRLAALGRRFPGYAAVWTHDLASGRTAGWNSDARFPAASTVKLGVLLAALRHYPAPSWDYDLRAMTRWSSNLAANRLLPLVGGPPTVEAALRRAGATRSTYPQGFRVGTSVRTLDVQAEPPRVSARVTTARDLGRILYFLQAGAVRNAPAARYALSLLLASEPTGGNVGLLRPWLPGVRIAQKNGWLHDARHTAAIVYFRGGPKIVVVLTYAPNLELARARSFGRDVLAALR